MILSRRVNNRRFGEIGTAKVSIHDLRESVGQLFFVWSRLERDLREAVADLDARTSKQLTRTIAQTLKLWKKLHLLTLPHNLPHKEFIHELFVLISQGLEFRNRLAHGINGMGVIGGEGNGAYISTVMNDTEVMIQLSELRIITNQLGYLSFQLGRISHFALNPDKWKNSVLHSEIRDGLQSKRDR